VKTIFTDRNGLYPWAMLFVASMMFWSAYRDFLEGDDMGFGLSMAGGGVFLIFAIKRLRNIRHATRAGDDITILRTTNAPDR